MDGLNWNVLLRQLDSPVCVLTKSGDIVKANDPYHALNPVSWPAVLSGDLMKKLQQHRREDIVLSDGPDRSVRWTLGMCEKEHIFASAIITDFSEDDRMMKVLKELNDQKFALDAASIVAITDAKGVITYVNKKFVDISKYSEDELLGRTHAVINSGFHSADFFQGMWATIAKGEIWQGEVKNRAKDGSYYWVATTIVPFCDEKNRPYQYVAIRTDITDRKIAMEQVKQEQARTLYAEKMASLGEMAAGIAHELGNPINAITSWLEVVGESLKSGDMDLEDLVSKMPVVTSRATQMKKIINGMLTFARDGSKDPIETLNVAASIDRVLEYAQHKVKKSGVSVRNKVAGQNVWVKARPSELAQVFVNLISNACDAVEDLDDRWIEVSVEPRESTIDIVFTDSGTGIEESQRDQIFTPFVTSKPTGKGTGLGLSISKSILEGVGGTLTLDSDRPNTAFVCRLHKPDEVK